MKKEKQFTLEHVRKILEERGATFLKTEILCTTYFDVDFNTTKERRFSLHINGTIKSVWKHDDGYYIRNSHNIIVGQITMYALLSQDKMFSMFMPKWKENAKILCSFLTQSNIEIAQEKVKKGDIYVNPFSQKKYTIKQDTFINSVLAIHPSGESLKIMTEQLSKRNNP